MYDRDMYSSSKQVTLLVSGIYGDITAVPCVLS